MKVHRIVTLWLIVLMACKPDAATDDSTDYLEEITIRQLKEGYANGTFTIERVVKDYLTRIDAIDKSGPTINAIIYVDSNAVALARQMDEELKQGRQRGPLHGIPVILKDNIDTDDMPTTAGATALRNSIPASDSYIARRLREAGAIIIAKANLSEWANFRADMSSSGWSGVGGQTKNPYVLDRNPCGSSSGSGAAIAANLAAFAIGTETNGSIVCPSNNNGLVGLKPTVGLLSRSGIIPISFTQDTPGPMARTVEDVAVSLGTMVGIDSADAKTLAAAGNYHTDYTPFLKADGLRGKRIGLMKGSLGYHAKVDTLMEQVVADLKAQGAEVVDIEFRLDRAINGASFNVLLFEFKDGLERYFASLPNNPIKTLQDLINFNKQDTIELEYFDQQLLIMAAEKGNLETPEYVEALAKMLKATREDGIDKLLQEYNLDALVAPTGSPAWKTDLVNGDHFIGGSSSLAAIAGYPSITVPMGFVNDLPVGVSFFSTAWREPLLIEIAYAYEQATHHRKAPKYILSN